MLYIYQSSEPLTQVAFNLVSICHGPLLLNVSASSNIAFRLKKLKVKHSLWLDNPRPTVANCPALLSAVSHWLTLLHSCTFELVSYQVPDIGVQVF